MQHFNASFNGHRTQSVERHNGGSNTLNLPRQPPTFRSTDPLSEPYPQCDCRRVSGEFSGVGLTGRTAGNSSRDGSRSAVGVGGSVEPSGRRHCLSSEVNHRPGAEPELIAERKLRPFVTRPGGRSNREHLDVIRPDRHRGAGSMSDYRAPRHRTGGPAVGLPGAHLQLSEWRFAASNGREKMASVPRAGGGPEAIYRGAGVRAAHIHFRRYEVVRKQRRHRGAELAGRLTWTL